MGTVAVKQYSQAAGELKRAEHNQTQSDKLK